MWNNFGKFKRFHEKSQNSRQNGILGDCKHTKIVAVEKFCPLFCVKVWRNLHIILWGFLQNKWRKNTLHALFHRFIPCFFCHDSIDPEEILELSTKYTNSICVKLLFSTLFSTTCGKVGGKPTGNPIFLGIPCQKRRTFQHGPGISCP